MRPRLEPLERRLLLTGASGDSTSSSDDYADAYQAALLDFEGPDLVGKDGPMARLGLDLSLLYEEKKIHDARHPGTDFTPSSAMPMQITGDMVTVDLVGTGSIDSLQTQLAGLGMQHMDVAANLFSGEIAISSLDQLAAFPSLVQARPSYQPYTSAGSVESQGDAALRADLARAGFGVDGSGVTVGILSDSFDAVPYAGGVDGVARDISTGDLPANTRVLEDSSGTDEGRGMAQLVHDVAPGAAIQFATAEGGQAHFANNIRLLANSGSDVIVDDIGYFAEPFYQDGVIAQAVSAVSAQGVPYFSAAGNSGDQAYESAFVDSGQTGGPFNSELHDFDPGPGVATHQQINIPIFGVTILSFQWDQTFASVGGPGSASDVDISILGADGTTVLTGSYDINNGGDPIELVGFFNDGSFDLDSNGVPDTTFYIQVELYSGPAPGLMKYVNFGDGTFVTFDTKSATSVGHPNAAGGIGVGASAYLATPTFGIDPPLLNDFSSAGGTPILFDTAGNRLASPIDRMSPQITGVDGTNTTFFGFDISQDTDTFPNFFGTSAAAPHVAAVAALMLQATGGPGSVSPQTIYDALESTAIDIVDRVDVFGNLTTTPIPNGQGFDRYSGFGLVDAAAAIQYLRSQVNIQDVTHLEGDSGTTSFVFNISFSGGIATPVLVAYTTADVTAKAPDDYGATSGILTFTPGGATTQSVTVLVVGDLTVEDNETFLVKLNVTGARALRSEAVGTILNDDVDISINDVQIVEGNTGTSNAVFTVSTFGAVNQTVKVNYVTGDGTATAPSDYLPRGGTLSFSPGTSTLNIVVPIVNDTFNEGTEAFFVFLSSAVGARLVKSVGIGTIIDNDPLPSLYVNDAFVSTISPGVVGAVFTIALDNKSGRDVTVHFATHDDTALADESYVAEAGDLTFVPGVSTMQVTVPIMGSAVYEPNERFFLDLSNQVNATIADRRGIGTIIFGDPPPAEYVVDDGDSGFSTNAGWVNVTNLISYQLDYTYHPAGNGSSAATWTFDNIPDGTYQVFTRWSYFSNRATNAPYTVYDGANSLGTISVNQQVAPVGDQVGDNVWQRLGTYQITSGMLRVRLTDGANGYVTADAVRIVSGDGVPQVVEMDVAGYEHSIADGDTSPSLDDATDFGTVPATSNSVIHTFTILNTGNAALHLTGSPRVQVSGDDAQDFTVVREPDFSVAPGATTSFDVMFHPTDTGLRQATISIVDDDTSEPVYDFAVQGTGGTPGPLQLTIDDSGGGFLSVGEWASNSNALGYQGGVRTSAAGNGSDRASWTFVGLAPGQYEVFATWVPFGNRATNAPFTVSNGDTTTYTTRVNQQQSAAAGNGTSLGTIAVTNGLLVVTLNDNANGYVVADSVTIVRQGVVPNVQAIVPLAHNAVMPQDVNADGLVSPHDALLVINSLLGSNTAGSGTLGIAPQAATSSTSSASSAQQCFLDVNGDGTVSPIDALQVINELLNPTPQPAAATSGVEDAGSSATPQAATVSTTEFPAVMAAVAVDQAMHQMSDSDVSDSVAPIDPATATDLASIGAADGENAALLTPADAQWSFTADADDAQDDDLDVSF